ncbi:hypothetical protein BH23PLA1_BH23PLA1_42730 [soil metagenome]
MSSASKSLRQSGNGHHRRSQPAVVRGHGRSHPGANRQPGGRATCRRPVLAGRGPSAGRPVRASIRSPGRSGQRRFFALNHLDPFLLLDRLKASDPSRIVVSSEAHRGENLNFDGLEEWGKYKGCRTSCRSKLANVLFVREFARRLERTGVATNACIRASWPQASSRAAARPGGRCGGWRASSPLLPSGGRRRRSTWQVRWRSRG